MNLKRIVRYLKGASECKEPDRNHYTFKVRERVHRQRLGKTSYDVQEHKWRSCEVGKCNTHSMVKDKLRRARAQVAELCSGEMKTLTAWSRTQQTVSLSSAEAELYALTTGVAEGMVTKHLLQEFGHEVILMNHVDSQSAKAWASKRGLGRMKHVMLKYMYVQDCCGEEADKSCIHQHKTEQSRSDDKVSHI